MHLKSSVMDEEVQNFIPIRIPKALAKLGNIVAGHVFWGGWETYVAEAKFVSGNQICF